MDLDPRGEKRCESPYRDYYSTGGCYRPPKRRRSYGWLAAVLGFFLLCAAAYIAMDRRGAPPEETMRQHDLDTEQVTAAVLPSDPAAPEETAALPPAAEPLAGEFRMTISSGSGRKMELPDIYKKVIPSVVSITTLTPGGNATGTGIVLSEDGYLVTNYHVISGAEEIRALLTSGEEYRAAMVGWDETSDLAVLKIDAEGLTPAEFGSSDSMEVGDAVVAIGDPLGTELRGTMTDGIICGIQRDVHTPRWRESDLRSRLRLPVRSWRNWRRRGMSAAGLLWDSLWRCCLTVCGCSTICPAICISGRWRRTRTPMPREYGPAM